MKKYKKSAAVLLMVLGFVATNAQSLPAEYPVALGESVTIDISGRVSLDSEKNAVLSDIYHGFISSHSVDEEGEFVRGGSSPDNKDNYIRFLHYVSRSPIKKGMTVNRRCSDCKGAAIKYIDAEPENPLSLSKLRIDCVSCPSSGLVVTDVSYTLICPTAAVPPLPVKPRIVKQEKLVGRAKSGDSVSQVEYASQLETGVKGVEKDTALAWEFFSKAVASGNGFGVDGLLRILENSKTKDSKDRHLAYVLRLLQAKIQQKGNMAGSFGVYPDELGVVAPSAISYADAKIAELEARALYANFKSRDIKLSHLTKDGVFDVLKPIKTQLEKAPLATARSKSEYVLICLALANPGEGFGMDRLSLTKQAATSLDPVAFGILGDVCERGLSGKPNPQAASIFYSISARIAKEKLALTRLEALESKYDVGSTTEMVAEFQRTKVAGRANINFIEAVMRFELLK